MKHDGHSRLHIGWREWLALPELGIPAIKAKVDTGARTSALHTYRLETFYRAGGQQVRFWIHPLRRRRNVEILCEAPVADQRLVKDSGGHTELRYVIVTPVRIGAVEQPVEITLASRDNMLFRMLLGRNALRQCNLVVDSCASYLTGAKLRHAYRGFTGQVPTKEECP